MGLRSGEFPETLNVNVLFTDTRVPYHMVHHAGINTVYSLFMVVFLGKRLSEPLPG